MAELEVLRFNTLDEYKKWLNERSFRAQWKAGEFHKKFGNDVIPIVVVTVVDECMNCWGEEPSYVFVNPAAADVVLKNIFC